MRNVVVTGCPRADLAAVDELASFGVATVHEAVVTTTSASTDGSFGELLATALQRRGVRGSSPPAACATWPNCTQ